MSFFFAIHISAGTTKHWKALDKSPLVVCHLLSCGSGETKNFGIRKNGNERAKTTIALITGLRKGVAAAPLSRYTRPIERAKKKTRSENTRRKRERRRATRMPDERENKPANDASGIVVASTGRRRAAGSAQRGRGKDEPILKADSTLSNKYQSISYKHFNTFFYQLFSFYSILSPIIRQITYLSA